MKNLLVTIMVVIAFCGCHRKIPSRGAKMFVGKTVTVVGTPTAIMPAGTLIFLSFGFPHPREEFIISGMNGEIYPVGFTRE
jgi:hypothetical protein